MAEHEIAILHPGEMGASIAGALKSTGKVVHWASEGRSAETLARAQKANLTNLGSLSSICERCDIVVSVCPPGAAEELARQVVTLGFRGIYLDANAVSPQRAVAMSRFVAEAGGEYVDGSIIGPPAWKPGTTRLYLAGRAAAEIAELFAGGPVEAAVIGDEVGRASALKMCYSAYSKGTTALLAAILAAADQLHVSEELFAQWSSGGSPFAGEVIERARGVTRKAWRFAGEMDEIAATMRDAGLPGEFHKGASEVYRRLAGFKAADELPSLGEVIAALRGDAT